jgi:hypothetical protein
MNFGYALLFAFVFLFQEPQEESSAIAYSMLQSTIASQEMVQKLSEDEKQMHKDMIEKVKSAKIVANTVSYFDGYGNNVDGVYYVPSKKIQLAALSHYRKKLEEAEKKAKEAIETMLPIIDVSNLKTGMVGYLGTSLVSPAHVKVLQVLDSSSFLAKVDGETILVKSCPTKDLTDGKQVLLPLPVVVLGTEKYQTVIGGSNTVFAVSMVTRSEFEKANEYVEKHKLKIKPVLRKWMDLKNQIIVEAEYISHDKLSVTVKNENGVESKIEINKLSREDRVWVKEQ